MGVGVGVFVGVFVGVGVGEAEMIMNRSLELEEVEEVDTEEDVHTGISLTLGVGDEIETPPLKTEPMELLLEIPKFGPGDHAY